METSKLSIKEEGACHNGTEMKYGFLIKLSTYLLVQKYIHRPCQVISIQK